MSQKKVLVVDLDHTLIKTDLLLEALICLLKRPAQIPALVKHLLGVKTKRAGSYNNIIPQLKDFIAKLVNVEPEILPYNEQIIQRIKQEKSLGAHVVLASASNQSWVNEISEHLGLFHEAFGSTSDLNLKGTAKRDFLVARYEPETITYIGDSKADIAIWKSVAHSIVTNPTRSMIHSLTSMGISPESIGSRKSILKILPKALRLHQWAKNVLLFLPILMAHKIFDLESIINCIVGFFAFSFLASAVYVLNDLCDIKADRQHPIKRKRPFAAGFLAVEHGLLMIPLLMLVSFILASQLPLLFGLTLVGYLAINIAYSFRFKKIHSFDVVLLATMYSVRIFAGGAASGVWVSDWLLAFSTFFFFGLAILKRFTEVSKMVARRTVSGRGYLTDDKQALLALGVSGSMLSTMILALYLNSPQVAKLYSQPQHLWLVLPIILFWIARLWIQASRNEIDSDPVVFALKDKVSYVVAALALAVLVYAK